MRTRNNVPWTSRFPADSTDRNWKCPEDTCVGSGTPFPRNKFLDYIKVFFFWEGAVKGLPFFRDVCIWRCFRLVCGWRKWRSGWHLICLMDEAEYRRICGAKIPKQFGAEEVLRYQSISGRFIRMRSWGLLKHPVKTTEGWVGELEKIVCRPCVEFH